MRSSLRSSRRRGNKLSYCEDKLFLKGVVIAIVNFIVMIMLCNHLLDDSSDASDASSSLNVQADSGVALVPAAIATVGYAISVTQCGGGRSGDTTAGLFDGPAVLAHSIHMNSIRNNDNNDEKGSMFDYRLYAFVHPIALNCSQGLEQLGYQVMVKDTPIQTAEIKNEWFKEKVVKSGCCNEREFLKLYSYTLMQHEIVVHLDMDTLILQPLDDLFHSMLQTPQSTEARSRLPVMFDTPLPNQIDAFFTKDYNMVQPGKPPDKVGVQGGFLVVRTSMEKYEEYRQIILEANFGPMAGWGKLGYGGYFGAMQIQGLCSYFYGHVHPGTGVELNRCNYNSMADPPKSKMNLCRTGQKECQDCRTTPMDQIYTVHYTICQKPWNCQNWDNMQGDHSKLCAKFHKEWFRVRFDAEISWYGEQIVKDRQSKQVQHKPDYFRGFCSRGGAKGYIPIQVPQSNLSV